MVKFWGILVKFWVAYLAGGNEAEPLCRGRGAEAQLREVVDRHLIRGHIFFFQTLSIKVATQMFSESVDKNCWTNPSLFLVRPNCVVIFVRFGVKHGLPQMGPMYGKFGHVTPWN